MTRSWPSAAQVTKTIVNNESSEIIRMLNHEFDVFSKTPAQRQLDLYPEPLRARVDDINSWVYTYINNGVYRCGFAHTQEAYEEAFDALFVHLDKAEAILAENRCARRGAVPRASTDACSLLTQSRRRAPLVGAHACRYLTGTRFTEADIRLFVTLVRFDAVYVLHFKTNLRVRARPDVAYSAVGKTSPMPALRGGTHGQWARDRSGLPTTPTYKTTSKRSTSWMASARPWTCSTSSTTTWAATGPSTRWASLPRAPPSTLTRPTTAPGLRVSPSSRVFRGPSSQCGCGCKNVHWGDVGGKNGGDTAALPLPARPGTPSQKARQHGGARRRTARARV